MAKNKFSNPSLADGRDLHQHLLPKGKQEWMPSMNLEEVITKIPEFINAALSKKKTDKMIGRF